MLNGVIAYSVYAVGGTIVGLCFHRVECGVITFLAAAVARCLDHWMSD